MRLPKVLIVEDESSIAELISVNLKHNGFAPVWAVDGEAAQREIDAVLPDAILLDWMLPGQSGLAFFHRQFARTCSQQTFFDCGAHLSQGQGARRLVGCNACRNKLIGPGLNRFGIVLFFNRVRAKQSRQHLGVGEGP